MKVVLGNLKIQMYKPWILRFWKLGRGSFDDDILHSWFIDIGPIQFWYMKELK